MVRMSACCLHRSLFCDDIQANRKAKGLKTAGVIKKIERWHSDAAGKTSARQRIEQWHLVPAKIVIVERINLVTEHYL